MKYLISGKNGFIGTALSNRLERQGHIVVGIKKELLKSINRLIRLLRAENPDYIIHLAAYGNHSTQTDDRKTVSANITGTFNMLQASKWIDYQRFYNISTSSVTLAHQTLYSASKFGAEKIVEAFKTKYGKPVVNVRPYSVYGPGEAEHRFIPRIIYSLTTGKQMTIDETATHDWIFIDDFLRALLAGETEIGTGKKTSNIEVVRMLEKISGKNLNYIPGTLRSYDTADWVAPKGVKHISLFEGLKLTYESFT